MQVLMFCGFFSCVINFYFAQQKRNGELYLCRHFQPMFCLSVRKGCLFLQHKCYKEDGDRSKKEKKVGEEWEKSVVKIFYSF
jgi:hypothetical protein